MNKLTGLPVVVVGFAVALASSSASAFLCTRTPGEGPSIAWTKRAVAVHRSGRGSENDEAQIERALQRGLEQWTEVSCADLDVPLDSSDLQLSLGVPTTSRLVGFDWKAGSDDPSNENIVVFRNDSADDPVDGWLHTFGALAITTVTFDTTTGDLLDADIEMNDVSFNFSGCDLAEANCVVAFDLQNTLTHELGHLIGLDHPIGVGDATMSASAAIGELEKRDLAPDDKAGVCTLYPAGLVAGECFNVGRPDPPSVRFEQSLCASGSAVLRLSPCSSPGSLVLVGVLLVATYRRTDRSQTRRRRAGSHSLVK